MIPRKRHGPPGTLTELQRIELLAWWKAKKHLGTYKTKARELGVPLGCIQMALRNVRRRAGEL